MYACMYTCVHVSICLVGANASWKVQSTKWGWQWKEWKKGCTFSWFYWRQFWFDDSSIPYSKMLEDQSILTIADPWPRVRISICCSAGWSTSNFKRTSYAIRTAAPLSGEQLHRIPVALTKSLCVISCFDNGGTIWQRRAGPVAGLGQILLPKMYMYAPLVSLCVWWEEVKDSRTDQIFRSWESTFINWVHSVRGGKKEMKIKGGERRWDEGSLLLDFQSYVWGRSLVFGYTKKGFIGNPIGYSHPVSRTAPFRVPEQGLEVVRVTSYVESYH